MRLITTITHEQKRAKVYRSDDEYIVKFYSFGAYLRDADYFTDNREDAVNTAEIQIGLKPL